MYFPSVWCKFEEMSREGEGDNRGSGLFKFAVGLGVAAGAVYGISKFVGSGNESTASGSNGNPTNGIRSIKVIENINECIQAIRNIESKDYPVVGLDCEWLYDWQGNHGKVSVLSLCDVNGCCYIIRLSDLPFIPTALQLFLEKRDVIKVGVGIDIDRKKLKDDYNVSLCGTLDLRFVAKDIGCATRNLAYLAKEIANITLCKDCDHTQWDDHPLPPSYINYAAMDAYAGVKIIEKVFPTECQVFARCSKFFDVRFTTKMNNF